MDHRFNLRADFGAGVAGVGPQIGFFFPLFGRQGYLNLRAYYEFEARNSLEGWNAYVTLAIEPPGQIRPAVNVQR